jgi:hypothetical protein
MKEGIFNRIMGIKTVLKSCFNDLKTIYSPSKNYNLLIIGKQSTAYNYKYPQVGQ